MNLNLNVKDNVKRIKKLIRKRSSSSIKAMAPSVKYQEEEASLSSVISTPMKAVIRTYKIPGLIVISITTEGLLTLYEPIGFMEDYENVAIFKANDRTYELFAVYDGHGGRDPKTGIKKGGKEVALWCVDHLPTVIKDTLEKYKNNNIAGALMESFEKADKDLLKFSPENVGATAIVVLRDVNRNILYFANLGDSRAVICKDGKSYYQTEDSDWTNPKELKRIGINKDNQSYIIKTKSGEKKKFILNGRHLNGEKWNLATSRSFGDKHFKLDSDKPPVIATPNVHEVKIDSEMKLILIASDGIWENMRDLNTEHFISKFIQIAKNQQPTLENASDCLKKTCEEFVKWCMIDHLKLDFKNYGDNIALIAIGLLNGESNNQNQLRWFKDIQGWKGKYDDNNSYLRGINDTITEESQDEDYGSDSSSCKFDFTELNK